VRQQISGEKADLFLLLSQFFTAFKGKRIIEIDPTSDSDDNVIAITKVILFNDHTIYCGTMYGGEPLGILCKIL